VRAVEFETTVAADGQIVVPPELASEIPAGEQIRVVVMWDVSFGPAWRRAGRQRFEAAYAPEDVIYEQLGDDSPIR
jgi:hypothetical protein